MKPTSNSPGTHTAPFPPGSRLVAYFRDSGGRDQDTSVAQQQKAVSEWCQTHGLILSRIFSDVARSGTTTAGRDQFLEMVAYFDSHPPEAGVIFWELSRFSRSFDDSVYYIADLRRQGYTVHSMTDNVPQGLDGRLLESIIVWKNAKYSEELRKNIIRGQRYILTAHRGKPGGFAPTGYVYRDTEIGERRDGTPHIVHHLEPDPKTAPLVRQAFEMRAAGATVGEIHNATHLFKWRVTYSEMLYKRLYMGEYEYGGTVYRDFCEPLVSREIWEAAQVVNAQRKERHGYNHPRAVRSRFFLTGLIHCRICGHPMHGRVFKRGPYTYDYYRCQSESTGSQSCGASLIPKEEIEAKVLTAVKERILVPDVLTDLYADIASQQASRMQNHHLALEKDRRDLTEVRARISRIMAAIGDAGHSQALIKELAALEKKEADLTETTTREEAQKPPAPAEDIAPNVEKIKFAIEHAKENEMGVILRGFVVEVRAEKTGGEVRGKITYKIPVPGSEGEFTVDL